MLDLESNVTKILTYISVFELKLRCLDAGTWAYKVSLPGTVIYAKLN